MANDEWERWRGSTQQRMKATEEKLEEHCERLETIEEKVSQVLVKLAVPLFATSLIGVVLGGVIVAFISHSLKR